MPLTLILWISELDSRENIVQLGYQQSNDVLASVMMTDRKYQKQAWHLAATQVPLTMRQGHSVPCMRHFQKRPDKVYDQTSC